ncbi:MAG TPA: hypothetical protein VJU18_02830 [Vicinamibacteria bacterium]|nr:hypothetical protein [Vicinamibacteria bacterium]
MLRQGLVLLLLGWAAARPAPRVVAPEQPKPIAVARLRLLNGKAEKLTPGQGWREIRSGARLATGDKLRVGDDSLLSIEFPWMRISAAANTTLGVDAGRLLATSLEEGRLEQDAEAGIIKLRTPEALVRGEGQVVVRRMNGATAVAVVRGSFRVQAAQLTVVVRQGQGTVVEAGKPPEIPVALPAAPESVSPGKDPVYVQKGKPILLSWSPSGPANHIQVYGLEADDLLIARDVPAPPVEIELPLAGTYRWRVVARTDRGLEGVPSTEGLVCVVDK